MARGCAIRPAILALIISCTGASAQDMARPLGGVLPTTPLPSIPWKDQDRLACEASLQAYNEHSCDKDCSDQCTSIRWDLSKCKDIAIPAPIACGQ